MIVPVLHNGSYGVYEWIASTELQSIYSIGVIVHSPFIMNDIAIEPGIYVTNDKENGYYVSSIKYLDSSTIHSSYLPEGLGWKEKKKCVLPNTMYGKFLRPEDSEFIDSSIELPFDFEIGKTYYCYTFGQEEFESKCKSMIHPETNNSFKYIGNSKYFGGEDTGEKLCITEDNQIIYYRTDEPTDSTQDIMNSISIYVEGDIHQIDPIYLPEGGVGYVSDKKIDVLRDGSGFEVMIPDESFTYWESWEQIPLIEGETYIVTTDSGTFNVVCENFDDFVLVIGNIDLLMPGDPTIPSDDSNRFFYAEFIYDGRSMAVDADGGTTFTISKEVEAVHKIDPKFLPKGGFGYVDNNIDVTLYEEWVTTTNGECQVDYFIDLEPGDIYTVIYNNVEYNVSCFSSYGYNCIGNKGIWDGQNITGEPFYIESYDDGSAWIALFDIDSETNGLIPVPDGEYPLTIIGKKINTIDPKFLPDTVVTYNDLYNEINNKPGRVVEGETFDIDGESIIAGSCAEVFNDIYRNKATGHDSHAEGRATTASGDCSHAEGLSTAASGNNSHAEGYWTAASGGSSHAEGSDTAASGGSSHAEGHYTIAFGISSHAEGAGLRYPLFVSGEASGTTYTVSESNISYIKIGRVIKYNNTFAKITNYDSSNNLLTLDKTLSNKALSNARVDIYIGGIASGNYSHAEGYNTIALGNQSHAENNTTTALGNNSHAEGYSTKASGDSSHTEGYYTTAVGSNSHTEGSQTTAVGSGSHAEGYYTVAFGKYSHAEGEGYRRTLSASGEASGTTYTVSGTNLDYIEVGEIISYNNIFAKVINYDSINGLVTLDKTLSNEVLSNATIYIHDGGVAFGNNSHAEGFWTIASGEYSHAEGYLTKASGGYSHAEGEVTTASGYGSHAEGRLTIASGSCSHAEGFRNFNYISISGEASGTIYTVSEYGISDIEPGVIIEYNNVSAKVIDYNSDNKLVTLDKTLSASALSNASACVRVGGIASGNHSHIEGCSTTASGNQSHAEGYYTIASGDYQHTQGKYNIESNTLAHIVGNGVSGTRSNAHTLDWNGNAWFAGDVYVGSTSGKDKDEGSNKLATETYVQEEIAKIDVSSQPIEGLATETYVQGQISALVNSAPEALNTLNELAAALGNDENFANTIMELIGQKAQVQIITWGADD